MNNECTRVYATGGKVAHLLPRRSSPNDKFAVALCGNGLNPFAIYAWFGTGSQDEIDDAKAMRLCKTCERKASDA